jgi:hypothetical protein
MGFDLRLMSVGLGAFAIVGLGLALIVPALANRWPAATAVARAKRLAMLRLVPAGLSLVAGLLVTASFLVFEPRKSERVGWMIPSLAIFGGLLLVGAAWRSIRIGLATRRLARKWLADSEPVTLEGINVPAFAVTSQFPIVAVVGLRRPKLVIARSVLASCTPEELRAVLAHEQGHLDRRDNLRRLLMAIAPDALAWLPVSERLLAAWRAATEEAADDAAAREGADGGVSLASALVKVARLAQNQAVAGPLPAATLYCGENLDVRVRRLLNPAAAIVMPPAAWSRTMAAVGVMILISAFALQGFQTIVEIAIKRLP